MDPKKKKKFLIWWVVLLVILLVGIILTPSVNKSETIQEAMKDAVLHETNKISFFGMEVNPSLASEWIVIGVLLIGALLIRIFAP